MASDIDTKIEALQRELDEASDEDPDLVLTTVRINGIKEKLYSKYALKLLAAGSQSEAAKWELKANKAGDLKQKAAGKLVADEARKALEEEEYDAETRRMLLKVVK